LPGKPEIAFLKARLPGFPTGATGNAIAALAQTHRNQISIFGSRDFYTMLRDLQRH
jgi:hypothetical protein